VLFIVGGAFAGLDHIIATRVGKRPLGFNNDSALRRPEAVDPFADVRPEDLIKFGLIPEFIGRLPMISSVSPLDRDALIRILIEPRNALIKQFRKLFELDGVDLEFTSDAVEAIADLALLRGTGARGLRAILEEVLLNVMYDVPSSDDVAQVIISAEVVRDAALPTLVPREKLAKRERREKSA
jgi:ATP-dependent Clp protease ATP-binding subunit ClpX